MTPSRKRPSKRPGASSADRGSGRRLAFDVLTAWQQRGVFANRVLQDLSRDRRVSASDRALAMELSYGVIRRQATLDAILKAFVDRPQSEIEGKLWTLLRIGTYQLVLMDGVPPHAGVNETVELARQLHHPEWAGLINGVLRTLTRAIRDVENNQAAEDCVPVDARRSRQLDRNVFPSPATARNEYFVKAYSFPRWLIRDWLRRFDLEETTRLCSWFNASHSPTLRVNRLRQSPDVVREVLQAAQVTTETGRWPESLRLSQSVRVVDLPGFSEGWFSVQDESSMAAARLLAPQPGEMILDLCAAPGGKTTHLAELMEDRGTIVAVDVDPARLTRITDGARRLGLTCIECRSAHPAGDDIPAGPFDRVLLDVPCSNTGVLAKRPEARWRVDSEDFVELTETQARLLGQALDRIKPGGSVVYSTCSIDPRENRKLIDRVLATRSDACSLVQEVQHQPGRPGDGGYQALLHRD